MNKLVILLCFASATSFGTLLHCCSLEKVVLDKQELECLNEIITQARKESPQSPNTALNEQVALANHRLTVLPLVYQNIFSKTIQTKANTLLETVCDNKSFENIYYTALTDQSESVWLNFQHTFCQATVAALQDKLPVVKNATPHSFLSSHLNDADLKQKSSTWVVPGLIVMMFGRKIERLTRQPSLTNK